MTEDRFAVDVMTSNPVLVGPQTTAGVATEVAAGHDVHHLLVVDEYQLRGVVCLCDLYLAGADVLVRECMHSPPVTLDDQATASTAARLMEGWKVGCLPVVDWAGLLRGVVTRRDLRRCGALPATPARCATCGSTHGIRKPGPDADVAFCLRCLEHGKPPKTPVDAPYFVLGGGD